MKNAATAMGENNFMTLSLTRSSMPDSAGYFKNSLALGGTGSDFKERGKRAADAPHQVGRSNAAKNDQRVGPAVKRVVI